MIVFFSLSLQHVDLAWRTAAILAISRAQEFEEDDFQNLWMMLSVLDLIELSQFLLQRPWRHVNGTVFVCSTEQCHCTVPPGLGGRPAIGWHEVEADKPQPC
jgi:hypothetical protein